MTARSESPTVALLVLTSESAKSSVMSRAMTVELRRATVSIYDRRAKTAGIHRISRCNSGTIRSKSITRPLDERLAASHTLGGGRIDVRTAYDETKAHETTPTARLRPARVRIPLLTNEAFRGVVAPSDPVVERGDTVDRGELIAAPHPGDISNAQHASIAGAVADVTESHIEIVGNDDK
ncbi:hypothetical protein ACNS7O_17395 (plasmid) [Haloferacaceae archaeon DSL9]